MKNDAYTRNCFYLYCKNVYIIAGAILLLEVTILDGALTSKQEAKYFISILVCIIAVIILTGIADNIPTL